MSSQIIRACCFAPFLIIHRHLDEGRSGAGGNQLMTLQIGHLLLCLAVSSSFEFAFVCYGLVAFVILRDIGCTTKPPPHLYKIKEQIICPRSNYLPLCLTLLWRAVCPLKKL